MRRFRRRVHEFGSQSSAESRNLCSSDSKSFCSMLAPPGRGLPPRARLPHGGEGGPEAADRMRLLDFVVSRHAFRVADGAGCAVEFVACKEADFIDNGELFTELRKGAENDCDIQVFHRG